MTTVSRFVKIETREGDHQTPFANSYKKISNLGLNQIVEKVRRLFRLRANGIITVKTIVHCW